MAKSSGSIVVVGAGIAGVSAAYHLAVRHGAGNVVLVEADNPLSMTSDKSTEAYRNWWPGPDGAMTAFMDRSIDLLEALARETGNRFQMNRRGYLFASADASKAQWLIEMAQKAERQGAGSVRVHESSRSNYAPMPEAPFDAAVSGADVITNRDLIAKHFPYLDPATRVVAHARRAGWLSAQQLGMTMMEAARAAGVQLVRARVERIVTASGRVSGVEIERGGARETIAASRVVMAAGPMLKGLAAAAGVELPMFAERHLKISVKDTLGVVPREAPMMIWLDEQKLPWSEDERALLAGDEATRWLTETFPWGVHGRPDGSGASTTLLVLFNYENKPAEIVFPVPEDEHYGEIALRGFSTMVPAMRAHVEAGTRPYVDGGYYMKTAENRPLIGPTAVDGLFVSGAYSGFGIMAGMAGGDLVARHVLGIELPAHAPSFALTRYDDPAYAELMAQAGDGGQL
ncbi:MAG: FAD-binding oxidoreductase [Proteobacteria bacterium]|nr:FAD-binding oxidoreductase [Pseudomonadota bacterium]